MKRCKLLGINIDSIGPDEVYDKILKLTEYDRPTRVVLLDTYLLMKAQFNKNLFNMINSADIVLPISHGIRLGLKFFKKKVEKIYNYFNFLITLLLYFTDAQKFIYILGGKKRNIEKADKNIRDSFPGIRLVGRFHSQYKKTIENNLITAIRKASPALIFVGDKSPMQEKWIYKEKSLFNKGVFIGVGNFINVVGGKGKSPSEKSVQTGWDGFKKLFAYPFRIFYFFLYILFLLLYKMFKNK